MSCPRLKEIHTSIGYHKSLVFVNLTACNQLETFPPIVSMKKLETLILSSCSQLQKFPDIQTSMDSLVDLNLSYTAIETIPSSSVGQFCTNLVSFNLYGCRKLRRIEGNFDHLKSLKDLNLEGCYKLLLGLQNNLKFPRFLRKLNLGWCNLGDGDIPVDIHDLINLQVLDLSRNKFSRLHFSLLQMKCLKYLNLSYCKSLVELPDLPSSIAVLKANYCKSLKSVGDLSNYKELWKVSLWGKNNKNKLIGTETLPHSMLQVISVKDHFMSITLPAKSQPISRAESTIIIFQLPENWNNDFSGFLLTTHFNDILGMFRVVIKQEILDSKPAYYDHDYWEEFDKNRQTYDEYNLVGYIPFASFRHISCWNSSAYPTKNITFELLLDYKESVDFKVGLVPRKFGKLAVGDSRDTPPIECWEEESKHRKTFNITYDSNSSSIEILWWPSYKPF